MVHVMGGYSCSTVATMYAKSLSEIIAHNFELSVTSDQSLAQQKAQKVFTQF